jgi:hypothetical protein
MHPDATVVDISLENAAVSRRRVKKDFFEVFVQSDGVRHHPIPWIGVDLAPRAIAGELPGVSPADIAFGGIPRSVLPLSRGQPTADLDGHAGGANSAPQTAVAHVVSALIV